MKNTSETVKGETWSISGIPGDNYVMKPDGKNKVCVAYVGGWPGITPEEHEANKHLIAAAPCLLEACKMALRRLEHYTADTESCDLGMPDERALAQLNAAITRATTQKEGAK